MSIEDADFSLFFAKDAWRVFRIIAEFVEGFETMMNLGPSVSVFGSARKGPEDRHYEMSVALAQELVHRGFAVITGGGPGLMEGANQGAQSAGGSSCGLSIDLPWESGCNPHVDKMYQLQFRYFFVRKVMFIRYAQGLVFLPGGFGTMDELFEALTLIQTKKIRSFPIYLMGKDYWEGLIDWIEARVLAEGCVSKEDLKLLRVTDDIKEVADGIETHYRAEHSEPNF